MVRNRGHAPQTLDIVRVSDSMYVERERERSRERESQDGSSLFIGVRVLELNGDLIEQGQRLLASVGHMG